VHNMDEVREARTFEGVQGQFNVIQTVLDEEDVHEFLATIGGVTVFRRRRGASGSEQRGDRHFERARQFADAFERKIPRAALDIRDVSTVQIGSFRQLFLRKTEPLSRPSHRTGKVTSNAWFIHDSAFICPTQGNIARTRNRLKVT